MKKSFSRKCENEILVSTLTRLSKKENYNVAMLANRGGGGIGRIIEPGFLSIIFLRALLKKYPTCEWCVSRVSSKQTKINFG
jgi:hypothetical protein